MRKTSGMVHQALKLVPLTATMQCLGKRETFSYVKGPFGKSNFQINRFHISICKISPLMSNFVKSFQYFNFGTILLTQYKTK